MKNFRVVLYVALIGLLSACSSPAAATQTPSLVPESPTQIPSLPPPTDTPVPVPTNTALPPTATLEPSPTADPLLFKDEFDGALGEGWAWTRENKTSWSLTNNPGWLEIIARPGNIGGGNLENILLRAIPDGNFEIETRINFKPVGDYQIAGILIYESAANNLQFGRAFCDSPTFCANDGFYADMLTNNNADGPNLATAAQNTEISYLRLRREGSKYTMYAGYDGETWQLIGEKSSDMKPLFIGLMAGQAFSAPQPAQFDYFVVNRVP